MKKKLDALSPIGDPIILDKHYTQVITYMYPGPLPCTSGIQTGCSDIVNAGDILGIGSFCDYAVVCAGLTVTIFYNRFLLGT
ncbi:hypothetical protein [Neptunomonas japonica]|uniref:hypothetical protein n=1 Tax=Neptunomonas japonica TaxID=417574 RepID=UPI00048AF681|nr:hypothetical protein [Neptunomonas japonica]